MSEECTRCGKEIAPSAVVVLHSLTGGFSPENIIFCVGCRERFKEWLEGSDR